VNNNQSKIEIHMPDGFMLSIPIPALMKGNPLFYAEAIGVQIANAGHEIIDLLKIRYGDR